MKIKEKNKFEWAVIGSGIAGIIVSEILTRENHKAILIEKNDKLASETTRDFHEWMHLGSLFTLIPDKLLTLKYILGAVDDLFEYYSCFRNMNLIPTENGVKIDSSVKGWFNDNHINFKFRIKNRKFTFPWIFGVARSIFLIKKIVNHDWLRRRAGVLDPFKINYLSILKISKKLFLWNQKFFKIKTSDFTMNSRVLLKDLLSNSIKNGLQISNSNEFNKYKKVKNGFLIYTDKEVYFSNKIVFCNGKKHC